MNHRTARVTARPRRVAAGIVLAACWVAGGRARADDAPPSAPAPAATLAEYGRWVTAADYSRDGQFLVTAGGDSLLYRPGDVVAWRTSDGARLGDFTGHPTTVWSVKISDDGRLVATAGYDGLVRVWDVVTRAVKHDLRKHKGWARAVAFSPDGKRLAAAGEDGTVVIWDTDSGAEVKSIPAHEGPVTCVAFSRDGQTVASGGGDKLVKLWDPVSGAEKARLQGHGDTLWSVAYSPDGSRLASAGADRTIKLWTTSDSTEFATLAGHKDWVTSLAFSPDGTRLVSGGIDGTVKLWDVNAKGEQEGPAKVPSSVWNVTFSPDSGTILAATHIGPRLLPTPAAKLLPPPPPPPAPPSPPAPAPLVPAAFMSMAGATATIAADGVVLVAGALAKDTYTVKGTLPAGGAPKAIRLEVLTDPGLPAQGPGRAGNGNFVLSGFAMLAGPPGAADTPTAVAFSGATADYEQPSYGVATALDGNPDTGWAIFGGVGQPHVATFAIAPDANLQPGAPVTITLDQQYADGQHAIGKFRLSVVQDPVPPPAPAEPPKQP